MIKGNRKYIGICSLIVLFAVAVILLCPRSTSADKPIKLGIFVFENLEGIHTQSSTFGTSLGSQLMPMLEKVRVEDSVPLQSNETVRILDELTKDRKVVMTTLHAVFRNGVIDYPAVVFADDAVKFIDLTWKVDDDKTMELAKETGLSHCLIGTCQGIATAPHEESAAGRRGLTAVTASVNVRLHNISSGEAEWMNTYRRVVSHTDPRLAFEQAVEMVAEDIAEDLKGFFEPKKGIERKD
ncbi:MAG: hypothetical protein GTO29_13405 [Candidatus Latescibacteria bacterium]|nr:hypothetical protein [Candidatus Latescibacterota bacterium]NIO57248.1 hypothetical protein [Candidatus Latescibacterota bacterium]